MSTFSQIPDRNIFFLGNSNPVFAAKIPVTVSLSGRNYLGYDLAQIGGVSQPILAEREHLQLEFRTGHSQGLLFYTGEEGRELTVVPPFLH